MAWPFFLVAGVVIWLLPALTLAVVYNQPQAVAATGLQTATAMPQIGRPLQPSPTPANLRTPKSTPVRSGPIILVMATPTPAAPPTATVRPPVDVAALELPGVRRPVAVTRTQAVPVGAGVVQWEVPRHDAGQHNTTPACGEPGNTIIVGHSVWYEESGVFKPLLNVEVGELIRCVNSDGQTYVYQVERRWEAPYEDGSWLTQELSSDLLTLYTCRLDLTGLVIVQAKRING